MAAPQDRGKEFENAISSLYELLGYRVKRNVIVLGQQLDIVCERFIPGVGPIKIAVECKYRKSGSVPNQEVQNFVHSFFSLLREGFTSGVIVSNQRFGPAAQAVVEKEPLISLHTQADIENQLLDIREVAAAAVRNFDESELAEHYVPLSATGHFPGAEATKLDDIGASMLRWAKIAKNGLLILFADYGGGKTTLLNKLRRDMLGALITGSTEKCPILLPLKEFYKYDNLDVFIHQSILVDLNVSLPPDVFWQFAASSKLTLLVDGFDEISTQADPVVRQERFLKISPLLTTNSPAVLTCRPSYFASTYEYNQIIASANNRNVATLKIRPSSNQALARKALFEQISSHLSSKFTDEKAYSKIKEWSVGEFHITLLDAGRIDRYLQTFDARFLSDCGYGWRAVRAFLDSVYDLTDLMQRPLLLKMIVETILAGRIDITQSGAVIGASALYEIYTDTQLRWTFSKGETRQLLSTELRREFSELAAVAMLTKNRLKIGYDDIKMVCAPFFKSGSLDKLNHDGKLSLDAVASDVQCCSFLKRADDDYFQFVHKSFMEFFVARHIKNNIGGHGRSLMSEFPLGSEILYFIGNFATIEDEISSSLAKLLSSKHAMTSHNLRRNIMGALLFCGQSLYGKRISNSDVAGLSVKRQRYWNVRLENIEVTETDFDSCTFEMGGISDSRLSKTSFKDCTFSATTLEISTSCTTIEKAFFTRSQAVIKGDSRLDKCEFQASEFELKGGLNINGCSTLRSEARFVLTDEIFRMEDNCFESSAISFLATRANFPLMMRSNLFTDCLVLGIRCSLKELTSMMGKPNGPRWSAQLVNCKGFAFITSGDVLAPKSGMQARALEMFLRSDDLGERERSALSDLWKSSGKVMSDFLLIDEEVFRKSEGYRRFVRPLCLAIDKRSEVFFEPQEMIFAET